MIQTDILIIGGGFSGIAAAAVLERKGVSFRVLEARDRLGGRVFTKHYPEGYYLDLGGQWIGPTQDRMYALVEEHGLTIFSTYEDGYHLLDLDNTLKRYKGLIPSTHPLALLNLGYLLNRLERLAGQLDPSLPDSHPKAAQWDRQTLGDFVEKHTYFKATSAIVRAGLETVFATNLNEISLLHALFYMRSGTSLDVLLRAGGGAQQDRIQGGMQLLVERMAAPFRDHIQLESPVVELRQTDEGVHVQTAHGEVYAAKKVISAIPPHLLAEIRYSPGWSASRARLLTQLPMGRVAKCFAVYDRPFWRARQWSGQVVADDLSPFQTVFDASPADGSRGVLLGFCIADRYEAFFALPPAEREAKALATFARYFGEEALRTTAYVDYSMADDPWSGGCYAAIYPPLVRTQVGNLLAQPEGHIHFAGTETADRWYGYIEGAVRAGERAAAEVLRALEE